MFLPEGHLQVMITQPLKLDNHWTKCSVVISWITIASLENQQRSSIVSQKVLKIFSGQLAPLGLARDRPTGDINILILTKW